MAKKGNWVAPENPIYGKGGVVESVTKFLPNVIGAVTGSGSSKKSSSKTDARKKALKKMAGK